MKKRLQVLSGLLISVFLSNTALAYNSYDYMGWINEGKPKYTKSGSSVLAKNDVSGTTIMSRLRKSYSYENRMPKIVNSRYKQSLLWIPGCPLDGYTFTDKTYLPTPYNGGEIGYTEWYDSQYGVFLDYETGNIKGTTHDSSNRPPKSVKQDFIDYANVQFPKGTTESAYIVTLDPSREFADAKSAAAIARNNNEKHYPIYANNATEIDADVKTALKNKGIKNLYILGGIGSFSITAGLTGDFNIIRCGGLERNDTQELLKNLPQKMNNPSTYKGDANGIVMEGVPEQYKAKIREYLIQEKSKQNASNLIAASDYIMTRINGFDRKEIGSRPNSNSTPTIVMGVNDGAYETYWIGYWSSTQGQYVYQYVLGNYYAKTILDSDVVSVEGNSLYKQNNNTYWTNIKDSFSVNTRGTISTRYDLSGIGLHLVNSKFGAISNSPKHEITDVASSNNSTFNTDFINKTSTFAKKGTYNGLNSITGKHTVTAKLDNQTYKLYSSTQYGYWSNPKDSGITIKTDGTSPTVSGIPSSEDREGPFEFTLKATDSLSGVKSMTLTRNGKTITGTNSITTTVDEEGENKFVVSSIDNVGNVFTKEFTVNIDRDLTISGYINPNPSPAGKKLTLDITTIGKAKKIKVAFPDELVKLATVDNPLILEREVTIEPTHKEKVFAWLPLNTPITLDKDNIRVKSAYKIYIEAENTYGKIVTGYIDLDVQGSIFDKLQYGIKATGYDRKK